MKTETSNRLPKQNTPSPIPDAGREKSSNPLNKWEEGIKPLLLFQEEKQVKGFSLDRNRSYQVEFGVQSLMFQNDEIVNYIATLLAKPLEREGDSLRVGEQENQLPEDNKVSVPICLEHLPDGLYRLLVQVSLSDTSEKREFFMGSQVVQICNLQDMIELRKIKKSPCGCD
ncbi:MAG: hypothetical protein H6573_05560 [Lewinellaceae bacterium]|nr:hypothetical protein [Phaeodactylibacter sp.]MCB0612715.1 hypothetical protein [Phaeodactylibacter sp.]MCB9346969.1 hypothetical protein [Lewinellaceae bacterium]